MQSKKGSTSNTENIKTKVSDRNKGLQRETKIKDLISIWKLNRYTMQTLEYRKKKTQIQSLSNMTDLLFNDFRSLNNKYGLAMRDKKDTWHASEKFCI